MKWKTWLVFVLLIVISSTAFSEQLQHTKFIIGVKPSILIPMGQPKLMFRTGGSLDVSGSYVLPFFRIMSVGADLGYHLIPLRLNEPRLLSSLSIVSGNVLLEFRLIFFNKIEFGIFATGGYYFAFLTDDTDATGHSFCTSGTAGIAFLLTPGLSIGLRSGIYTFFGLFDFLTVALNVDFRRR